MNVKLLASIALIGLSLQFAACGRSEVSFSADVQPILEVACLECHNSSGEGIAASGFSVVDYAAVMRGTELGPAVIAGSRMSSTLYRVVAGKTDPEIRMPPHHDQSLAEGRGPALGAEQIEIIGTWIDQGAKNN